MPGRSSVTPAGRCTVSPSRNQPRSHIGRCSIAKAGRPCGSGTGSGKNTASLLGNMHRSVSRSGW